MNQSKFCEYVKNLFFVEFENQNEISICVVNEYLLSGLLNHTARHTHLNSSLLPLKPHIPPKKGGRF